MSFEARAIAPVRTFRFRQIALPTEHGGWGFLLEPLVAGLIIAFSSAAPWIALMTIGAFLIRQPLKFLVIFLLDLRNRERGLAAGAFVLFYGVLFAVGLTGTFNSTGLSQLLPFLFVLPFAIFQIYTDVSRQSRQLMPEITGVVCISSSIAVMALSSGLPWINAVALWLIFVSRLIPSILYVRHRLRLEKGKKYSRITPTAAHVCAVILITFLAYNGLSPILTVFAMLLLLDRAVSGLSPNRTKMRAMQIGIWELIYGFLTVMSVVVGHFAGF